MLNGIRDAEVLFIWWFLAATFDKIQVRNKEGHFERLAGEGGKRSQVSDPISARGSLERGRSVTRKGRGWWAEGTPKRSSASRRWSTSWQRLCEWTACAASQLHGAAWKANAHPASPAASWHFISTARKLQKYSFPSRASVLH